MQAARKPLTFEAVREIALSLAGVVEGTAYGSPALKIRGNRLACVPVNKSAEPNSALFSVDLDLRAALLESKPEIYYVTDHYAAYPTVLVRLSNIERKELRRLLGLAWSFVSSKKSARTATSKSKAGKRAWRRGPAA